MLPRSKKVPKQSTTFSSVKASDKGACTATCDMDDPVAIKNHRFFCSKKFLLGVMMFSAVVSITVFVVEMMVSSYKGPPETSPVLLRDCKPPLVYNEELQGCGLKQEDDGIQGMIDFNNTWRSHVIYYTYSLSNEHYGFDEKEKTIIRRQMDTIMLSLYPGCLEFIELERDEFDDVENYMFFVKKMGKCEANVGLDSGNSKTEIRLSSECFDNEGIILHELLHVVGAYHEMNRPDRDLYLDIDKDAIDKETYDNEYIIKENYTLSSLSPYDVFSVMNYPETKGFKLKEKFKEKFKRNGIYPLTKQMMVMSAVDIHDISRQYSCKVPANIQLEYKEYVLDMVDVLLEYAEECTSKGDTSKICNSYIFEAFTYLTDLESDTSILDKNMTTRFYRSNKRLSKLLPEIKHLIENKEINTLDKWFKHYVRSLRDQLKRRIRVRCQQRAYPLHNYIFSYIWDNHNHTWGHNNYHYQALQIL